MTMDDNNSNNSSSNWLGFSLSSNMKMGVSSVSNSSVPTSFFLAPPQQLNTCSTALCFPGADVSFSSGFHHPPQQLSVMPIKSDGSLCIMEALSRSQSEDSSPKLENFLGSERETVPLSLNSIYYQEDAFQQHYPYYSTGEEQRGDINNNNNNNSSSSSLVTGFSADQISQTPNWVARSYSAQQAMEQQLLGSVNLAAAAGQASEPIGADTCLAMETKKRGSGKVGQKQIVHRKSIDTFGQRTSQYRGVTKHRWTGRYEAHLWDNSCKKEGQTRKGRQVYLGGYDMEEKAARAYDLAALKYWGPSTHINFPVENYKEGLEEMKNMTRQEFVAHLRRRSSGFSRGASMYRGVTRHHQHGRWQARIGRVAGNKDLYLGTFSTQEEAAEAYDVAAIKFRGANAVTNFDITRYDVDKIMSSNTLLAGEQAKRIKPLDHTPSPQINRDSNYNNCDWKMVLGDFPQQQQQQQQEQQQQQQMVFDHQRQEGIPNVGNYQGSNFLQASGSVQLSNASSIVTSLNSSREGSPAEKSGSPPNIMMFAKAPVSWISPPTANFPVYAAWSDAS